MRSIRKVIQMETVDVVIRLPKNVYETIQQIDRIIIGRRSGKTIEFALWNGVKNGTVLPKGHGKLIDSNVLWDAFQDLGQDFYEAFDFAEANAVIEADKESEK